MGRFIEINPERLIWAREAVAATVNDVAKAAKTKPEMVMTWEKGERGLTYGQLSRVASALMQHEGFFLVQESPPERETPQVSFRRTFGDDDPSYSLLSELQLALSRREEVIDIMRAQGESIPTFDRLHERDFEVLCSRIRGLTGVSVEAQSDAKSEYKLFRLWREGIEGCGVLVFHCSGIAVEEFRGLAVDANEFPIILLNGADVVTARSFTLLHEFCHIVLGESDLARADVGDVMSRGAAEVEVLCNRVAAELLMPLDMVSDDPDVSSLDEVSPLASKYNVSLTAMVVRLASLGKAPDWLIGEARQRAQVAARTKKQNRRTKGGGPSWYRVQARNLGGQYAGIVFGAMASNIISRRTASQLLSTRPDGIEKLYAELNGG